MSGWLFLIAALLGGALVANAARPRTGPWLLMPSWLAALLTVDLALHHLALLVLVTAGFVWAGALDNVPGKLASLLAGASAAGLIWLWRPAPKALAVADQTARALDLDEAAAVPRGLLAAPFTRVMAGVRVTRDIEFFRAAGRVLRLDLYRSEVAASERQPALIYLHGGAWVSGDKRSQGLPLCNHLAANGWVCCNVNYRLSPAATYPDPVVDCKAAIAWLRTHADEYNVDHRFIALAGASSGAHIAAMAALIGDPALQPGFEAADTSVQAVVSNFGVYDLTNRFSLHHPAFFSWLVGPMVIKAFPDTEPERFRAASPRDHVVGATMPWLVLHGEHDRLVPVAEARDFAAALQEHGKAPVGYAEFPATLHGFDIWFSHRAIAAVELSARFLNTMYRRAVAPGNGDQ